MNKQLENKALEINKLIKESFEYKQYQAYVQQLSNSLLDNESEIFQLQQEIVNQAYLQTSELESIKEKYNLSKAEFLNDDFVKGYQIAYEQFSNLVFEIKEFIENMV